MESMMLGMLAWIGIQMGADHKIPNSLPAVEYRTQVELRRMQFCENLQNCKDEELPNIEISALFDIERGIMLLPLEFNLKNVEDQSTILHELIHFVQRHNGLFEKYCLGLLEAKAYKLTDKWREEKGLPLKNMNPAIMIAMSCMPGPT